MGMMHPGFWQHRTPPKPVRIQRTINTLLRWSTRANGAGLARGTNSDPVRLQFMKEVVFHVMLRNRQTFCLDGVHTRSKL